MKLLLKNKIFNDPAVGPSIDRENKCFVCLEVCSREYPTDCDCKMYCHIKCKLEYQKKCKYKCPICRINSRINLNYDLPIYRSQPIVIDQIESERSRHRRLRSEINESQINCFSSLLLYIFSITIILGVIPLLFGLLVCVIDYTNPDNNVKIGFWEYFYKNLFGLWIMGGIIFIVVSAFFKCFKK